MNSQLLKWSECNAEYLEDDYLQTVYKLCEIRLSIPNGGIIAVSVKMPNGCCYDAFSEELEKYHDVDFHVEEAKQFIDLKLDSHAQVE